MYLLTAGVLANFLLLLLLFDTVLAAETDGAPPPRSDVVVPALPVVYWYPPAVEDAAVLAREAKVFPLLPLVYVPAVLAFSGTPPPVAEQGP